MERAEFRPPPSGPAPAVAAVLSLFLPGLGQILEGRRERGGLLLLLTLALLGLIVWLQVPLLLVTLIPFWLWNALDAYQLAGGARPNGAMLFLLAALPVYAIGWRITEIDFGTLLGSANKVQPLVTGLLQPALLRREVELGGDKVQFQVPCAPNPPPLPPAAHGPTITPGASCGVVGESLTLVGTGFPPNTPVQLWWINPIGAQSRVRVNGSYEPIVTDAEGNFTAQLTIPQAVPLGVSEKPVFHTIEARYVARVGGWHLTETFWLVVYRMLETIAQALMATFVGSILAAAISFFGARNLMAVSSLTRGLYYVARGIMNILRSIEPLIMAIVFVVWVGLGPFAGVLALIVHTIAALGKLYSEAIESIEPGPIEAIRATGANQIQTIVYAVIPQVLPPWIAFTVYRWDINVRMSTIIGFVGGGGIGFLLAQWIRLTDFRSAGAAIWAIAVVVAVLDYLSARVRERVI
ncbi:MAG: phosphonate ABC transporter, permease protein PhnE [Ardenticatenaceae bacterium]|nr:phosphonate ABC transporter, permease protein PhnE [Ardenticatenaceae bacterium]